MLHYDARCNRCMRVWKYDFSKSTLEFILIFFWPSHVQRYVKTMQTTLKVAATRRTDGQLRCLCSPMYRGLPLYYACKTSWKGLPARPLLHIAPLIIVLLKSEKPLKVLRCRARFNVCRGACMFKLGMHVHTDLYGKTAFLGSISWWTSDQRYSYSAKQECIILQITEMEHSIALARMSLRQDEE